MLTRIATSATTERENCMLTRLCIYEAKWIAGCFFTRSFGDLFAEKFGLVCWNGWRRKGTPLEYYIDPVSG